MNTLELFFERPQRSSRRLAVIMLSASLGFAMALAALSGFAQARALVSNAQEPPELQVERLSDLDFGRLAKLGVRSGSVTIEPQSGNRTIKGGLEFLSGQSHRAKFEIIGLPGARVRIQLPSNIRIYSGQRQGDSVRVRKLRFEIDNNGIIASDGKTTVWVGGTLVVAKKAPPGDYRGFFRLRATYDDLPGVGQ